MNPFLIPPKSTQQLDDAKGNSMTSSRRRLLGSLLTVALLAVGASALAGQSDSVKSGSSTGLLPGEANTVHVVQAAKPSVAAVTVTVEGKVVHPLENLPPRMQKFFKEFSGKKLPHRQPTRRAAGSGFVVAKPALILTNYHVIANALKGDTTKLKENASVKVQFESSNKLPVKVVGVIRTYDLALLQLKNPDKLPEDADPLQLANSDKVQVGQKAIAIGNPFLLESTVTQGIVSAINRQEPVMVSGAPVPFIQTDAAINPGSSGGPLFGSQGKVIGINDAILAPNGTFIGVGLAIPSNIVRKHLDELKEGGFIEKAMIGIAIVSLSKYPEEIRSNLDLPDHGLMIVAVKKGGPGDEAGLEGAQFTIKKGGRAWPAGGDIILKASGKTIKSAMTLQNIVFSKPAGTDMQLLVRHDDQKKQVTVTLEVLGDNEDNK